VIQFAVHTYVSAPREEVFDLIADIGLRASWTDHYMHDLRLENTRPSGVGAAARFRVDAPRYGQWVETEIVEADRPRRIAEATRGGRSGKTRGSVVFELSPQGRSLTRVEMTFGSEAGTPRERVLERLGARRWLRRQSKKALDRLREILEEPSADPLPRTGIAAWEPSRGPRFGASTRGARHRQAPEQG
jgi:uncharacterized protein YndB with AHSA1/START domain